MPECCASAKNGGSPTHLSSTPHLWATKKFGFRKLFFCIVESACWIAQKRIVGLTMVSKSFFLALSYNDLKNENVVSQFLLTHSKISKHPAFQSQVLWILPRPLAANFVVKDLGGTKPTKPTKPTETWLSQRVSYPRVGSPINVAADTRTSDHLAVRYINGSQIPMEMKELQASQEFGKTLHPSMIQD